MRSPSLANKMGRRMRRWKSIALYQPILRSSKTVGQLTIITGADTSHYRSLKQCIASIKQHERDTRLVVVDLGFSVEQRNDLEETFNSLDIRRFPYENYPEWLDIRRNAGEYAWKPPIVAGIMEECGSPVVWMDAGDLLLEPLLGVRRILAQVGFYAPYSHSCVSRWTHPGMIEYLHLPKWVLGRQNLASGFVAVNPAFDRARSLIHQWQKHALVKDCIAPEGSSRANHRQDQSLLTVLSYVAGLGDKVYPEYLGFDVQRDIDRT